MTSNRARRQARVELDQGKTRVWYAPGVAAALATARFLRDLGFAGPS